MTKEHRMTVIAETKDALLLLEQQLRQAREGAMPLSRERVAALAFHLSCTLEHLAVIASDLPDNDADASTRPGDVAPLDEVTQHGLLRLHEELSGAEGQRFIVASLGSRWCVIEGRRGAPPITYEPRSWHEHHEDATRAAIALHRAATARQRLAMELVKS